MWLTDGWYQHAHVDHTATDDLFESNVSLYTVTSSCPALSAEAASSPEQVLRSIRSPRGLQAHWLDLQPADGLAE